MSVGTVGVFIVWDYVVQVKSVKWGGGGWIVVISSTVGVREVCKQLVGGI
jgi:hypothetical protein